VPKRGTEHKRALAKSRAATLSLDYEGLVTAIAQAHDSAQRQAVQAVNLALTLRNWLVGYHIVEYEQHGSDRAQYGERLLENLTRDLRQRLGRGFGWRNLEMFRRLYLRYPISQSLIAKFGFTLPVSLRRVHLCTVFLGAPSQPTKMALRLRSATLRANGIIASGSCTKSVRQFEGGLCPPYRTTPVERQPSRADYACRCPHQSWT